MSEVHNVGIICSKREKVDRIKELIQWLCGEVRKESNTLRYLFTETIHTPEPEIAVFETYKDLGSADQHRTEPHFKEFFRLVKEEGLLAKEPHIVRTKAFCGFDLDHKLI